MKLQELLHSLSYSERDFIAGLDYGTDQPRHRLELDSIIDAGGVVDYKNQGCWHPYEVIELGKNWLQANHEREYSACMGIVLKNILLGNDERNDIETIIDYQSSSISMLPLELKQMLEEMIEEIIGDLA